MIEIPLIVPALFLSGWLAPACCHLEEKVLSGPISTDNHNVTYCASYFSPMLTYMILPSLLDPCYKLRHHY